MLKILLLSFIAIFSFSTFAKETRKPATEDYSDPCNYLDQSQCLQAGAYCSFLPAKQTKGVCTAGKDGVDEICKQAHLRQSFGEKEVEKECYNKMETTKCLWIPSLTQEEGCYMKEKFKNIK